MSIPPFLSEELLQGDPPGCWEDFVRPQLRKFPLSDRKMFLAHHVTHGSLGTCNYTCRFGDNTEVSAMWIVNFFHHAHPVRREAIWSLKRQARIAAVLEKVHSALGRSSEAILVPAKQHTRIDCLRALHVFSDEGQKARHLAGLESHQATSVWQFSTRIYHCYGWMKVRGESIVALNQHRQCGNEFRPGEEYFALVYEYLPPMRLHEESMQRQLDFFHKIGFRCHHLADSCWEGPGVLVNPSNYYMPVDQQFPGTYAYSPAPVVMECPVDSSSKIVYRQDVIQAAATNAFYCDQSNNAAGTSGGAANRATYDPLLMMMLKFNMGPVVEQANRVESRYQEKDHCPRFFSYAEGEKIEYAEDELAKIKIPEIEPQYMNRLWLANKRNRERFLDQIFGSAGKDLTS